MLQNFTLKTAYFLKHCSTEIFTEIMLQEQGQQCTKMVVVASVFLEATNRQRIIGYLFTSSEAYQLQVWTIRHVLTLQSTPFYMAHSRRTWLNQ